VQEMPSKKGVEEVAPVRVLLSFFRTRDTKGHRRQKEGTPLSKERRGWPPRRSKENFFGEDVCVGGDSRPPAEKKVSTRRQRPFFRAFAAALSHAERLSSSSFFCQKKEEASKRETVTAKTSSSDATAESRNFARYSGPFQSR